MWSDDTTHFYGAIDARPGALTGDGGLVEVSGKDTLNMVSGNIQTGIGDRSGNILLDPRNIYIQDALLSGIASVKIALGLPSVFGDFFDLNGDRFGISSALNGAGDILVVGAYEDDTGGSNRGASYIFSLNTADLTDIPTYEYKLAHGSAGLTLANGDNFGSAVALNTTGDILAVGAYRDDTGGANRGAAYLFNLNTGDLTQDPTLRYKLASGSPGLALSDGVQFGNALALNGAGDILAVGSWADATGGNARGAAYLFSLNTGDLTQAPNFEYKLAHGSPGLALSDGDYFGQSVALNDVGDILAIGARGDDTGGSDRGAAYLFNLNTADLTQAPTFRYKIDSGTPGVTLNNQDFLGESIALNGLGDILAIGAYGDDTGGSARGAVHLFNLNTGDLTQNPTFRYKLAHGAPGLSLSNGDFFGKSVALNGNGDILAVGAFADTTGAGGSNGAYYTFRLNTADLTQAPSFGYKWAEGYQGLTLNTNDAFGASVALNQLGDILAVGANSDDTGGSGRGAAYLFNLNTTDFTQVPTLQYKIAHGTAGVTLSNNNQFGRGIALNGVGDILAVGASFDSTGGSFRGAVHLFNLNTADLTQDPTLQYKLAHGAPGLALNNFDQFGTGIALNGVGDILAVGTYGDDTGGSGRGAVHLFNLNTADLTQDPTLQYKLADGSPGLALVDLDSFGRSVALNEDGDILAVGASGDDTGGNRRGAAYLFNLNTADLTQAPSLQSKIDDGTPGVTLNDNDQLGYSIALNDTGDILAVGAFQDDTGGSNRGAVYLFNLNTTDLTQNATPQTKLSDGVLGLSFTDSDQFGFAVALNGTGDLLAVGATSDDTFISGGGATYLFNLGQSSFNQSNGIDLQFSPNTIETLLSTGNNLTLQASNDIFVNDVITANNAWGDGGNFTLQAGRSILINADITTDNGDLTLIANDLLANGVVDGDRLAGNATITQTAGTTIDVGTGTFNADLRAGTGKTNSGFSDVLLSEIFADQATITSSGNILDNNAAADNLWLTGNATFNASGYIGTFADPIELRLLGAGQTMNSTAGGLNGGIAMAFTGQNGGGAPQPRSHLNPTLNGINGLVCWNGTCFIPTSDPGTTDNTPQSINQLVSSLLNINNTTPPPFLMDVRQNPWYNGEKTSTEGPYPLRPGQEGFEQAVAQPHADIEYLSPMTQPATAISLDQLEQNPDLWQFIQYRPDDEVTVQSINDGSVILGPTLEGQVENPGEQESQPIEFLGLR